MNAEELRRQYEILKDNYKIYNEMNPTVFEQVDYEEWIMRFQKRAAAMQQMFRENNQVLAEIEGEFRKMLAIQNVFPDEECQKCYQELFDITGEVYMEDTCDLSVLLRFCDILKTYFEEYGDVTQQTKIALWRGYALIEYSRTGNKKTGEESIESYRKVTESKNNEAIWNCGMGGDILAAYSNLAVTELTLSNVTTEEAEQYYKEYLDLIETELYKKHRNESRVAYYGTEIGEMYNSFLLGKVFNREDHPWEAVCEEDFKVIDQVGHFYEKMLENYSDPKDMVTEEYGGYLQYLILRKECTWEYFFESLYHRIRMDYRELCLEPEKLEDPIEQIFNPIEILMDSFFMIPMGEEMKNIYVNQLCDIVMGATRRYRYGIDPYALNETLLCFVKLICKKDIIKDPEEREMVFMKLSVARYVSTYIHSSMVKKLCHTFLNTVIDKKPELLLGVFDCQTEENVKEHKDELLEFIDRAAMYHDIGKNEMVEVINTEYRSLTDLEFSIIRTHPEKGAKLIQSVDELKEFVPMILGHHRSYDGKRGYPMSYDNTSARDKALVDLLTICDCMEAATDFLSRNYERTKTLEELLGEFKQGAGTAYHPGYVELLATDQDLFGRLKEIVGKGRYQTYYMIYRSFFRK